MNRFLMIIIFFFLFLFNTNKNIVLAQVPTLNPIDTFLNSNSICGGVNQTCCDLSHLPQVNFGISGLPFPFDVIIGPFNNLINSIANGFVSSVDSIRKFIIDTFKMESFYCKEGTIATNTNASCICLDKSTQNISRLCLMITKPDEKSECMSCVTNSKGIWTSIGCIESDISEFIKNKVLGTGIGLAGGFALLCMIYAAFQMQSSQGNPEKLKKAQEMLTSCIMGLILIIFSVFILQIIGVNILRIPEFIRI